MHRYLRDQIDWPQAFPAEEYAERRRRVRQILAARGLDAIYVNTPANLTWLTGYDMIWYHGGAMTGLLLRADEDATLLFDGPVHRAIAATTPEIAEVVWFEPETLAAQIGLIARTLAARGLGRGRIALEPDGYSPRAAVLDALAQALRDGGATVVGEPLLIEELRLVKSPREITVVRRTAEIADAAMAAVRDALRPGVSENELEGVLLHTMMGLGGGYPAIRTMIASGPRSGTHHSPPQGRVLSQGDLVFVDFCGCYHRYHVNLNRTFSLGQPDPRWTDLLDRASGSIAALQAEVKPGDPWSKLVAVGNRYIDSVGLRPYVWWLGSYALGIAVPPDWTGSFWAEPREGIPDRPLLPGMVFNFENQFDVFENWPGGSGAAYIETFVVTEQGLEVLSRLPRTLTVV